MADPSLPSAPHPKPLGKEDVVWALHTFEAENDDELTFEAGEKIVVLERDDQYGDGWFQGRNERGEIGLFPQSYTSSRPPSFFHSDDADGDIGNASTGPNTIVSPTPVLATTTASPILSHNDKDTSPADKPDGRLAPLSSRRDSVSETSVHSRYDDDDEDDAASSIHHASASQRMSDGAAHRAALAARVHENAERAAQEERERAEARKRDDEERYREYRKSGLIEGLQLSDESGEEDEKEGPLPLPSSVEASSDEAGQAAGEKATPAVNGGPAPASLEAGEILSTTPPASADAERPEIRPRADTQPSIYAESTYSTNSSIPPVPSPPVLPTSKPSPSIAAVSAPEPLDTASLAKDRAKESTLAGTPAILAVESASPVAGDETPRSPAPVEPSPTQLEPETSATSSITETLKSTTHTTAEALTAGAAGVMAVATTAAAIAGVSLSHDSKEEQKELEEMKREGVAVPKEAEPALKTDAVDADAPLKPEMTASPAVTDHSVTPVPASAADAVVESSAPPATATPTQAVVAEAPAAPRSATPPAATAIVQPSPPATTSESRSSTPATPAALSSSVITAATTATPAASVSGGAEKMAATGTSEAGKKELPTDPMNWDVDDVVEWGRQKGFDQLTLSKFAEHEISGDVLLEMDVAMLKEIDLVAFGRRVHIYNAIKELRLHTQPTRALTASQSTAGSFIAPSMTGYEPDSPTSLAYSPSISALHHQQNPHLRWQQQHLMQGSSLTGFGIGGDSAPTSLRAPSSLGQQSMSNLRSSQPASAEAVPPVQPTPQPALLAAPIPLIAETPTATPTIASPVLGDESRKAKIRPSIASSIRPRSSRRTSDRTAGGDSSATSVPNSPDPGAVASQSRKSSAGDKTGFFGTLPSLPGRSRKAPPRVPSALLVDSDGAAPRPRPRTSLQDRAKRSTRLFGSFGTNSGSEKSPTAVEPVRSRPSNSTLGGGRDAPTAMTVKSVDPATKEMMREKAELVTDGNLMDKIGRPDHSGWMRKRGEKYNTWKMRFFVLKGVYLYYLKTEAEQKAKGVIDLTGYRLLSDPDIRPGEYAFKIVHDTERAHYFAAAEQITVRTWMKEIMKATILRDYSTPVVSSCDIEVLPLEIARTTHPRPPSPSRRALIQKKRYAGRDPNKLSDKDATILMDLAPGSPLMNGEDLCTSVSKRPSLAPDGTRKASTTSTSSVATAKEATTPLAAPIGTAMSTTGASNRTPASTDAKSNAALGRLERATSDTRNAELLAWLNSNLPSSCPLATDLSSSLRSGRLLVRLLENLSGESSGISDGQFDAFHQQAGEAFDTAYLDTIFSVFDFITPLASTDDISMEDMITGNEPRLTILLERIHSKFPAPVAIEA
ncbi:phospholipid binding protein [Rhodotorula toruloides]|uniref:Phospholipid binding protein n=1 Tax=Rhodotorula toruloides TaxID=5286 RepID=A0A511KGQ2_RHOTO|nr:phospholipid binding protein [Rhodotorula toruloides]